MVVVLVRWLIERICCKRPHFQHAVFPVASDFLVACVVMYACGRKLIDVLGTRRVFVWIMITWSLACMSQGVAVGFRSLEPTTGLLRWQV